MSDHKITTTATTLHVQDEGEGPPVILLHGLGMSHTVWDEVRFRLPDKRLIMMDLRGHGQSDAPRGPYTMGGLIKDVEDVCDAVDVQDAVVVGLSLGGMIAQGLAVKRLDLIRALVLIGTAAKFGQVDAWHARAQIARGSGMTTLAPTILRRWNSTDETAKRRLVNTDPEGYAASCEAIAGTDFYTPTSGLRLPTLGLCGDKDKSTPPDLVRETTDLIPGSEFHLIKGAGHLAPETHGADVAKHLHTFMRGVGHV